MKNTTYLLLLLCIVGLVLGGCDKQPPSTPTSDKQPPSTPTSTGVTVKPVIGVASDPGSSLAEYDPDRTLYIALENCDRDLYPDMGAPGFSFSILSVKPLDMETISISLPIETEYDVYLDDTTEYIRHKEQPNTIDNTQFPYYLYQIYAGTDWKAVAKLYADGEYNAYKELLDTMALDYAAMPLSDIPEFYVYSCAIYLHPQSYNEEILEYVDFTIGDQVIRKQIGSVRIHEENYLEADKVALLSTDFLYGFLNDAWSDGTGQWVSMEFIADEDMTLTNMRVPEGETIEDVSISLYVTTDMGAYSYQWDPEKPVNIYKGEKVCVRVTLRDTLLKNLIAFTAYYLVLEYETEDGVFYTCAAKYMQKEANLHEMYAIVFNGVDVEPYYRYYYYPVHKREEALD